MIRYINKPVEVQELRSEQKKNDVANEVCWRDLVIDINSSVKQHRLK